MKNKTPNKNIWLIIKRLFVFSVIISTLAIAIFLGAITIVIRSSIKEICSNAEGQYNDSCAQSLIKLLSDKNQTFHNKNDAIWTLGRMRSQEALPTLQKLYTGIIPDREPYNGVLSQYEIRKAILRIDKNANVSFRPEKTLKERLFDCMPKSDFGSKKICDDIIKTITTFTQCADAGFPIQESFPERCQTPDGRSFTNTK